MQIKENSRENSCEQFTKFSIETNNQHFSSGDLKFWKKEKVSSSWTSKFIRRRIQLYVKNVRCRISLLALKITWKLKLTTSTYIQTSLSKMEAQLLEFTSVVKVQNLNLDDNLTKTSIMDISKFLGRISTNGLPEIKIIKSWV